MTFDFDDFGANHVISDMCQTHDCRDVLLKLKEINPAFKTTLFAVPGEMTPELLIWCSNSAQWIELAMHGFYHYSNYECEKTTYEQMDAMVEDLEVPLRNFVKGFKAPGWQISDDVLQWLADHHWWVADQDYNTERRPYYLKAYINRNGEFFAHHGKRNDDWTPIEAWHGHTWDCVGNGIYETFDQVSETVKKAKDFQFVSEVLK